VVLAPSVFVDELMRSLVVEVHRLFAYRTSYFGHILSKNDEIFTSFHFGWLLVVSPRLKSEMP